MENTSKPALISIILQSGVLLVFLLIGLVSVSQSQISNKMWIVRIDFSNPGYPTWSDSFGVGPGYTECIDTLSSLPIREYGLPPPPPPIGNTDARFYNDRNPNLDCLGQGVRLDFRGYQAGVIDTFEYQIQIADSRVPWYITWDTSCITHKVNSLVLEDVATGGVVINIDMTARDTIKFASNLPGKALRQFYIFAQWKSILGVTEPKSVSALPNRYSLNQNYPNPFNPATKIEYSLPHASYVTLKVFNLHGEEVATLVNGEVPAGQHVENWNAANVASGMYFYRLRAGTYSETRKLVVLK
ncbi:MAG: T9SS type A sorting domain-containing protein [Bacteroidota bacterium]